MTDFEFYGAVVDRDGNRADVRCPMSNSNEPFPAICQRALELLFLIGQHRGLVCPMKVAHFSLTRDGEGSYELAPDPR